MCFNYRLYINEYTGIRIPVTYTYITLICYIFNLSLNCLVILLKKLIKNLAYYTVVLKCWKSYYNKNNIILKLIRKCVFFRKYNHILVWTAVTEI